MDKLKLKVKFNCKAQAAEELDNTAMAEALLDDPTNAEDLIAKNIILDKDNDGPGNIQSDRTNR